MAPTDRVYREIGDRMHRLYPGAMQPEAVVSKVILSDGEAAWVSTGLHGACTLTPTHKGASLGVMATATMSMGGLPPQVTSQFIAAGEGRDVTP
ncbi:hypothetical protein GCM10007898_18670 [Dyella flagellata]|uniref:Uncharacterized protein n=2 Tax=Dyella flagellata TaxID=1867833 RepID=A0ABQ5XB44_9GAMM|nr:hypothetical protein GCM10007898_18670 [Dyella flagellata]